MSISKKLREFSDALISDEETTLQIIDVTSRIKKEIMDSFRRRYLIDRISHGGGLHRKTSLSNFLEVNMYVYINERFPPYHDIIDELCLFLQTSFKNRCKTSRHGVLVEVSGLKISLLIARNFLHEKLTNHDGKSQCEIQNAEGIAFLIQNMCGKTTPFVELFGPSLQETYVEFDRCHSEFTHALIRLAKYWFLKLSGVGLEFNSTLLYIIELLAVRAAEREEKYGNRDMCNALFRFLSLFELPHEVDIFWTRFYDYEDSPYSVRNERPLLLDPCNPFVNLLSGEIAQRMSDLWFVAASTYSRLTNAQKAGTFGNMDFLLPETPCTFL